MSAAKPILVDFRRFEGSFSQDEIREFRCLVAGLHTGGGPRRAAYVSDDPIHPIIVRLHKTANEVDHVADPVTMRAFSSATHQEAVNWLGDNDLGTAPTKSG